MTRNRCGVALLLSMIAVLWTVAAAFASDKVSIPFKGNEASATEIRLSPQFGWTMNFQNGAPEERGAVAAQGNLIGYVSKPDGAGPFPFIILMHGCGGYDTTAQRWAELWRYYLADHKVGVLALDSFTTRGVQAVCGKPDAYWSRRRVDDAYSALDFLVTQPYAKADRIFLMGRSNGGQAVLFVNQDIYKQRHQNLFAGIVSLYPNCAARRESNFYAPMMIFIGALDDANLAKFCEELAAKKRPANHPELTFVEYPETYHGYDDESPFRYFNGWREGGNRDAAADTRKKVIDFLTRHGAIQRRE